MRPSALLPPLIPSGLCLMAPLSPGCPPLPVVKASVTMTPYFPKDGVILFPFGTSGLWDIVQMSSPSERCASLCPFSGKEN